MRCVSREPPNLSSWSPVASIIAGYCLLPPAGAATLCSGLQTTAAAAADSASCSSDGRLLRLPLLRACAT